MFAHTIQPLHPPRDLHPPGFNVPGADLVHRAGKHHTELVVGELENIRESLFDRQFPGAKDFLPVNIDIVVQFAFDHAGGCRLQPLRDRPHRVGRGAGHDQRRHHRNCDFDR